MSAPAPDDDRLLSASAGIPVGPCPSCEREVVAYLAESALEGGPDVFACVHCDGVVRGIALIDESELVRLGYEVQDPLAAGCGTGCGAGGCGTKPRTIDEILAAYRRL